MEKVITYNFRDNFIEKLADFLIENFYEQDSDLSRVACVFGGRRPALFLRKALAQRIKRSFIPPVIFAIDDFVDYTLSGGESLRNLGDLDAAFLIYNLAKENIPHLLSKNSGFAQFLPWAKEIVSFIEQLDLENIDNDSLSGIEKSAQIGYDIPQSINRLLANIVTLRVAYHSHLDKKGIYSRGIRYRRACREARNKDFKEFEKIVFCNFFYLHATEQEIIKAVLDKNKGICLFQGSRDDWSVLDKNAKSLNLSIAPQAKPDLKSNVSFYQGFDLHSQVCLARQILAEEVGNKQDSLILLPRPPALIPLLTEISSSLGEFNVSLGYPLKRGPLYALFNGLLKVQESRKDSQYYTRDYLKVLKHPLVKNLNLAGEMSVTRVLVHRIEELLSGSEESSVGGSLFLSLRDLEDEDKIYLRTSQTLKNMDIRVSTGDCRDVLKKLHHIFFRAWEEIKNLAGFAQQLDYLLGVLVEKSQLANFPFNFKVVEKLHRIREELGNSLFSREDFEPDQIWDIFRQKLEGGVISFSGSPLKGLQILGLFETRALNFENVIVIDVNESALPKLKIYEPLIPREVMLSLGLNRLEKEEEIQRYQFMRLISSAKKVHIIYAENQEREKSRFIEELLWRRQKEAKKLAVYKFPRATFELKVAARRIRVKKTKAVVDFLKKQVYSASRLNTYLSCPLQFYYQYVLGLKERQDLLSDPEASCIGTFLHELLEDAFKPARGKRPVIDAKFKEYFFKIMEDKFANELSRRMKSDSFLLKRIIENRLNKFLDSEKERNVARLICLEERRKAEFNFKSTAIPFNYTVDRIDELEDKSLVIIDYKSGGVYAAPKRLASLENMKMEREAIKDNLRSFQLPLYYYFVSKEQPAARLNAELYSLRTLERRSFIHPDDYLHREQILKICLKALEVILEELFDPDIPFTPDREERKCEHCSFTGLCG